MRTIREVGIAPRDWDPNIRNPLAQAGAVWRTVDAHDLGAAERILGLRRTDPGGIFAATESVLGRVPRWTILGDNVIGAWSWDGVSLEDQYRAVRKDAGAFIASAMAYLRVSGADGGAVLDALSPRTVSDLPVNGSRFVLFTTPSGGVDEEAVVVRTAHDEYMMSCGGGKPPGWLTRVAANFDHVEIEESPICSFNIKGPQRLTAILSLVRPDDADDVRKLSNFETCLVRTLAGAEARILRSMIGYEVWAEADNLAAVWRQLLEHRPLITPCGWELLSVYRMECRAFVFGLFPQDLHSASNLFEVGAGWMVPGESKRDYVGREALALARDARRFWLAGLRGESGYSEAPLVGREVFDGDDEFVGYLTSAAYSPREGSILGFAHLVPGCTAGTRVVVEGRNFLVATLPFGGQAALPAA